MKAPASSLTVISLLANQLWCRNKLWYRNRVKIKQLPTVSGTPTACPPEATVLETPTPRPPQITRLPQELVQMIISYFIYDTRSLLACSTTCRSWYIAAVVHLHHSLATDDRIFPLKDGRYLWPGPLQNSYDLGLLPLVKRFSIRLNYCNNFTLDDHTLRYFSALTNLQELGIDYFQVHHFMPNIQRYFGYFAPTLRFLALKEPGGSCRQILYFIGLFPNLQDLKLFCETPTKEQKSMVDAELAPLSVPPLRGRLTLTHFTRGRLMKDMIILFGGLRFRHIDLFRVKCVRLLLDACAETLETLRLYPTDFSGNDDPVHLRFDLSRNKSLRTLETTADSMVSGDANPNFLKTLLSTIASPLPLNIVIIYQHCDFGYLTSRPKTPVTLVAFTPGEQVVAALRHQQRFKELHEMYMVRKFRLVLSVDVPESVAEYTIRALEHLVNTEKANGGFDYLLHEPLIIS